MFNLIQNENMKIYRRPRTWVLAVLLLVMMVTISFLDNYERNSTGNSGNDWRVQQQKMIEAQQSALNESQFSKKERESMERDIKVAQYSLEHNIPPVESTLWGNVKIMSNLISVITLFTVIICGDMVAGEFTWGTIKLLLIRPATRSKILLSKYLATVVFALFMLAVLFVGAILVSGVFYGFQDIGVPYLHVGANGQVVESALLPHVISTYALKLIELVMIVTLAFMISTVFRSASLAIGMSIFIMFAGQALTMFFARYSWGKYFLFANTDLTQYIEGTPLMEGMTMGFSIAVLVAYFILFNGLSLYVFRKRDVAA